MLREPSFKLGGQAWSAVWLYGAESFADLLSTSSHDENPVELKGSMDAGVTLVQQQPDGHVRLFEVQGRWLPAEHSLEVKAVPHNQLRLQVRQFQTYLQRYLQAQRLAPTQQCCMPDRAHSSA